MKSAPAERRIRGRVREIADTIVDEQNSGGGRPSVDAADVAGIALIGSAQNAGAKIDIVAPGGLVKTGVVSNRRVAAASSF